MTPELLLKIMPFAGGRATIFAGPLTDAMNERYIDSPKQQAAFLAQVCHESGSLRYTLEVASGAEYDVGAKAKSLGNTPEDDGDGERYKGRGLIQITGRANYARCGSALNIDLLTHPQILERPVEACRSAAWFWWDRGLGPLAEKDWFGSITKVINGGYNGLDDRLQHWLRARKVLGV